MSILSSVQDYLAEYDGMEIQVLTDETEEQAGSYALALSGSSSLGSDCLGNEQYQSSFVFYAKEASANEIDRKENHDFLEEFGRWLEGRNRNGDFPDVGDNCVTTGITVANAMLYGVDEGGTSLYQIQIQLFYERKNELWL